MTDKTNVATRTADAPVSRPPYVDPFSTFRGEMDRLMDSFFGEGALAMWPRAGALRLDAAANDSMMPRMDVTEDDEKITVTAEMPGLSEDDVEVTLNDDLLVVKGEKRMGDSREEDDVHVSERRFGSFQRSLRLPDGIDEDKITAHVDKGVLTVVVPKLPGQDKPERNIPVGTA